MAALVDIPVAAEGQQGATTWLADSLEREVQLMPNNTLLLHYGDISYARGIASMWDQYFYQYQEVFKAHAYMTTPGNHEILWPGSGSRFDSIGSTDSGGECGVVYHNRLRMPHSTVKKQWYAFSQGPVRFLHLSSEMPFGAGSEQYKYVQLLQCL
jgi:hypothetical protein